MNDTWNAHTMFWAPGPNSTITAAAALASHVFTPERTITRRRSTQPARCRNTTAAWYGT